MERMTGTSTGDLRNWLMNTPLGGRVLHALDRRRTPGIDYLSGQRLLDFGDVWYTHVEAITRAEKHLLTKTQDDLEPAALDGRVLLAIDTEAGDRVIGCIVLWHLGTDDRGEDWYELGTFVVIPEYRYGAVGPKSHKPIADTLYRLLLCEHRDKNILGTTTNPKAIHTGMRHGMQMISFQSLPLLTHNQTCICPSEKTGVRNNMRCLLKDRSCRVRVSYPTWIRMGQPYRIPYTQSATAQTSLPSCGQE